MAKRIIRHRRRFHEKSIEISLGDGSKLKMNGHYKMQEVEALTGILDNHARANNSISAHASTSGFGFSVGKNISVGKILLSGMAVIGTFFGCKAAYKLFTSNKPIPHIEDADAEEIIQPVIELASDIRDRAVASQPDYDAGQLIGKLLYAGDQAIIYGEHGAGKSVLSMQIASDISEGKVSLLYPEDNGTHFPRAVLYYDAEMDDQDYQKLFGEKDISYLSNLKIIHHFFFNDVYEWLEDVKKRIASCSGDVIVVIDNLTSVTNTQNADVIRKLFLNHFQSIQDEAAKRGVCITFVVVAHTNKQKSLAGTSNLTNFATTVLGLEKHDDKHIRLRVDKMRKYGEIQGKTFLLEKKQTADGYKYDELVKEIGGNEAQASPESEESTKPEWKGKLSLEVTRKMKEFYKPGLTGHGYGPTAKEFGLNHATEAQRELQKLEIYEAELVASEADYCQQDER